MFHSTNHGDLPEWIQRQNDDADPLPDLWSLRRRLAFGAAVAALMWTILVFAFIGIVAVFGTRV